MHSIPQFAVRESLIARKANTANIDFLPFDDPQQDIDLVVGNLRHFWTDVGKIIAFFPVVFLQGGNGIVEEIARKGRALFEQDAFPDFGCVKIPITLEGNVAHCWLFDHSNNQTHTVWNVLGEDLNVVERAEGVEPFDIFTERLRHIRLAHLRL